VAVQVGDDPGTEGRRVPHLPPWQLDARIEGQPVADLGLGLGLQALGATFKDVANQNQEPTRLTLDAWVRWKPVPRWPEVSFTVRNLTDRVTAWVPSDPLNPGEGTQRVPVVDIAGYPLPGRSWWLGVTWTLE